MANEQQYYAPIIEAMVNAHKLQQEKVRTEIASQQQAAEERQRDQQLKQAQEQIENAHEAQLKAHELAAKQLEVHRMSADAEVGMNRLKAIELLGKARQGGMDVNEVLKQFPGAFDYLKGAAGQAPQPQQGATPNFLPNANGVPAQISPQGQPQTDLNASLYNPTVEAQNVQQIAAAKLAPEAALQKEIQARSQIFEREMNDQKINSQQFLAGLSRQTELQIAQMHDATARRGQNLQFGNDPGTQSGLLMGGATGMIKLDPKNPMERPAFLALQERGWKNPDPKEIAAMKTAQQLLPIFDKLDDFVKKAPTNTLAAAAQGAGVALKNKLGISSDLQTELDNIKSQAMTIGMALESQTGRPLSKQLELDINSLVDSHLTKDRAAKKVQNLKDLYVNKFENVLFAGMPPEQREAVMKANDIVPPKLATNQPKWEKVAVGPGGHEIGLRSGKWYDTQTGQEFKK